MARIKDKTLFSHGMAKWGLFMAFLFVVWFAGWFLFANFADGKIGESLSVLKERGIVIECENREIKGFPFRIGVNCDGVKYSSNSNDLRIEGRALRTTAILYTPGELIAELDGPVQAWLNGMEVTTNWKTMRLFADVTFSGGFDRISLNYSLLKAATSLTQLSVGEGGLHLRPTPGEVLSLDIAGNAYDVSILLGQSLKVPKASLSFDVKMENGYSNIVVKRQHIQEVLQNGVTVQIRSAGLRVPGNGRLVFVGPLELHRDGTLSGEIQIGVSQVKSLVAWARKVGPQLEQVVAIIGQAVAGMGKKAKFGDDELSSINVRIDRGVVRLGFIQLVKISPMRFNE